MKTHLATKWLVCLAVFLLGTFGGMGASPVLQVEDCRVSLNRPDPRNPFLSGTDPQTGAEIADPNAYLATPCEEIGTGKCFYVSLRMKVYRNGVLATVDRPNLTNLIISCTGRQYKPQPDGTTKIELTGALNSDISDSVFTTVTDQNPNPHTGGAWIYGLHNGRVVTVAGSPIRRDEAGGATMMDLGAGDFLVGPQTTPGFSELWVIGVKVEYSQQFTNAFANLKAFWDYFGRPYSLVLNVGSTISIDSRLNSQHGCRSYATYPSRWVLPTLYCGDQDGGVKPFESMILTMTEDRLCLHNRVLGNWTIESATSLEGPWSTVTGCSIETPSYFTGNWRNTLVLLPPRTSGTVRPQRMAYRLRTSTPPRPPFVLSSPSP